MIDSRQCRTASIPLVCGRRSCSRARARPAPTTPACCARSTRPACTRTSSPAVAWARSARCSPRSTAAPRLWEASGIWKGGAARRFYRWRAALRVAAGALLAAGAVLALPAAAVRDRHPRRPGRLPDDARRLRRSGQRADGRVRRLAAAVFSPGALPLLVPRLVLFAVFVAAGAVVVSLVLHLARARGEPQGAGRILWRADRRAAVAGADAGSLRAAAVEPDSRRGAARSAAGCRAGPPLRRAAHRQSRPAGLPRAAAGRARHGRAARSGRSRCSPAASRAILWTPPGRRSAARAARGASTCRVSPAITRWTCWPRRSRCRSRPSRIWSTSSRRAVARRDAPAVRPSGLADAAAGGSGRRRRRAGHPASRRRRARRGRTR